MNTRFDVVVIGAGHAGCEAALSASRLGATVGLVTLRADRIAKMSCNPAIGGVGKGHLVREIDVLGGAMAQAADSTGIQYRRLNLSRGPAVQATRCQSDAEQYSEYMTQRILSQAGVTVVEGEVTELIPHKTSIELSLLPAQPAAQSTLSVGRVSVGRVSAGTVIVTTGTFLKGLCHVGDENFHGGRVGDRAAYALSDSLQELGIEFGRFKTGTTPRLYADSIDWDCLQAQQGDEPRPRFSFDPSFRAQNKLKQLACYLTYTSEATHQVIADNLSRSPIYTGVIEGIGPRYCPSIEDKITRFADKNRHQIFLEPEGLDTDWIYPNGISTSLPKDVQLAFLQTIEGLENVRVAQYGYAVEYDFAQPTQLHPSLMSKTVPRLFMAGQINGTSGYEEAAAQGLIAGVNAVRYLNDSPPLILGRDEAYIGVMIDDLVTKGVDEPYRMFTSRAEHRLVLRESNAEGRLCTLAHAHGLIDDLHWNNAKQRIAESQRVGDYLKKTKVGAVLAKQLSLSHDHSGNKLAEVLRRPEITIQHLLPKDFIATEEAVTLAQENIKYSGYIKREEAEIKRLQEVESVLLSPTIIYKGVPGLSREIQEKLESIRPLTLAQAGRIPGVTPAALSLLRVQAHRAKSHNKQIVGSATRAE